MEKLPNQTTVRAWIELNRAQRNLLEQISQSLKDANLPPLEWYDVLYELHKAGKDGLRQFEIGELVLLSKHNLSRLIDKLEQEQLVRRESCVSDGRGNHVLITKQGTIALRQIWPVYGSCLQRHIGAVLTDEESQYLAMLLGKLNAKQNL